MSPATHPHTGTATASDSGTTGSDRDAAAHLADMTTRRRPLSSTTWRERSARRARWAAAAEEFGILYSHASTMVYPDLVDGRYDTRVAAPSRTSPAGLTSTGETDAPTATQPSPSRGCIASIRTGASGA